MNTLTHLDHLRAVFGTRNRIEHLEAELDVAARHHTEPAEHMRAQLAAGTYDHPHSLITPGGAAHLVHDTLAATSTALAVIIHTALDSDQEENQ